MTEQLNDGLYFRAGDDWALFSTNYQLNLDGVHVLNDHRGESDFPDGQYEFLAVWKDPEGNRCQMQGGPDNKLVLLWYDNEFGKRWPSISGKIGDATVDVTPAVSPVALLKYLCALIEGMIVGTSGMQGGTVEGTIAKIKQLQRKFGVEGQTGL